MTGGNNWVNAFSGNAVKPAQVSYEALTIASNTALLWPTETLEGNPYVASQIDVTASAPGLSISMPNALYGATGPAGVFTNIGTNTFTLTDSQGNQIAVIAAGQTWLITLTDNTTATGSWRAIQIGATTSNAQASALAGAGLAASGTVLEANLVTSYINANTLLTTAYRAVAVVWQGATGTVQLDTLANLTAGWWAFIINEGTGPLTISTSGSDKINGVGSVTLPAGAGNGQFYAALVVCSASGFNAFGLIPSPVAVSQGGTGATMAPNALINLGGTTPGISIFTAPTVAAILSILGISQSVLTESTVGANVNPAVNGTAYVATAAITLTLPLTTGLTKSFVTAVYGQGGAVTVTPAGTDKINNGTAGATYSVPMGTSAFFVTDANGNWWPMFVSNSANGTVTSVALADGSTAPIFVITGSPVTVSGTLTATLKTQNANLVFAGPSSGGAAQPSFRALVGADIPSGVTSGAPNTLRNSGLTSWFNGTSGTITTTTGVTNWTAEGVFALPSGANMTWARVTTVPTSSASYYGLQFTGAASVSDLSLRFVIESFTASRLAGQQCTFQIPVLNNTGGSITPTITTKYAGSQDSWGSPTTDLASTNLQSIANGASGILSYTFPVSVNAANGYEINIDFGNNFSSAAKSVTIGGGFDMRPTPGLATGLNSSPPVPFVPDANSEMGWNKRFFQTSYPNGTAPGSDIHLTAGGVAQIPIEVNSSNSLYTGTQGEQFKIEMRAAPTVSYWDMVGNPSKISAIDAPGGTAFVNNLTASLAPSLITPLGFLWWGVVNSNPCTTFMAYAADARIQGG
jgi:hypothetical protein